MGKKHQGERWPRLRALIDNDKVQDALAELAAAALSALAMHLADRKKAKTSEKKPD